MKKSNLIKVITIIILAIVLAILIYFTIKEIDSKNTPDSNKFDINSVMQGSENVETKGANEFSDEQKISNKEYESSSADENALLVKDGGNIEISDSTINKKSGDSTSLENSEFYGVNSGFLVTKNSTATIRNSKISTSAKGANAVFSTGENSKIYVYDTNITTTSDSSRGLDATYGGYIEADNVTISTQGGSCATLATDRGEGTVIARNSKLSTKGSGSPIIYSTGNITLENSEGTSTGSQNVVIEGKNTATVTNSKLTCSGRGNRNNVDNCGIMIYQSMSGDAGEGTGTFNASNSTLKITSDSTYYKTAPFFFITNTKAIINLENNEIDYGSGILLSAKATSEWGNSGSNGGKVTLNATNQKLNGNIEIDNISTAEINLKNNSSLNGAINTANTAKSITLNLDKSSKLTLTKDCYVTQLTDEDSSYSNINFNGYKLYVNGVAIN